MKQFTLPLHLSIKKGIQGYGVFANEDFKKSQVLFKLEGEILDHPTRTSVQIGKNQHVENQIAAFMNHNCSPNAKVNKLTQSFICLRDIKKDEEITFDYHQNEDNLAAPFICGCCGKKITGKKATNKMTKTGTTA